MASGEGPLRRRTAKSVEAAATGAETEKATGVKHRLTAKEIRDILAEKLEPPSLRTPALKRSNPELVPRPWEENDERLKRQYILARAFYDIQERLPKFQDWVRTELKNKGYVEVDEELYKRKADVQAMIDRYWPETVALIHRLGVVVEGGGDQSESESESESDSDDE